MLHQPSLKLPERKRGEWSSGSCRSPSPSLYHPVGTGTTTPLGQKWVAMPTSPAIVPVWWHVGTDRPRVGEVVGGSSEEETGTRQSRRSLSCQGIVKSCLAGNWRCSRCHVSSHIQRNSPSYTASEQHLIPSLISCPVWK